MAHWYNKKKSPSHKYNIGDMVLLDTTNITTDRPTKKLTDKNLGLFKILDKIRHSAYKLELPLQWNLIHPVFNEYLLKLYHKASFPLQHQQLPKPPPVIVRDIPEYKVEKIIASRRYRRKLQYLVKWTGWPMDEQHWEPAEHVMPNAQRLIINFHLENENEASWTMLELQNFINNYTEELKWDEEDYYEDY
jgi:Chromo (CHRromatin Organisation MOdifier) domain